MKRLVIVIILIIMGLLLSSCEKHIRELPIENTIIYIDCNRYDTIPDTNIFDKKPDYVICTNRYTNEEETMSYQDYVESKDINAFLKDLYDELKGTLYTQEQVNHIVDMLLKEIVEIKYTNDPLDVSYDEETQTFTITEYNQHGEVFDIDIVTVDEIIESILNHN